MVVATYQAVSGSGLSGVAELAEQLVKTVDAAPDLTFDVRSVEGPAPHVFPGPIAHIPPDPFEPAFDPGVLAQRLRKRHTGVKRALLDQSLISGVGNIYADEALWRAGLHWARPT